jgi:transposase-like protein
MDSIRLKRAIAIAAFGGTTLVLGGAVAHVVDAQQTPAASPTPTTQLTPTTTGPGAAVRDHREQFLAAVAAKLNVTPDQLKQAMGQARQELGLPQRPGGPGGGPAGAPSGGPGHDRFGMNLGAAAQAMNLSVDQLRQELPGKSLADVARAHNVDPATVANALKADATAHIDQAVSAGRMPADRAAQLNQDISARIDQLMNRQVPADAPLRGGPGQAPSHARFQGGPRL